MHSQFCAVQLHDQPKMYETNEGFAFYVTSLLEQLNLLDICCILFRYLLKVSSSRNNNPSFFDAYLNYPNVKPFISSSVFPIHQFIKRIFLSWRLRNTWNLNFDCNFQVFLSHQDRKTNSFCFEIYWPLKNLSSHPR